MNPYSSPNNDNQSTIGIDACENSTFKHNVEKHDRSLLILYSLLFHFVPTLDAHTPEVGRISNTCNHPSYPFYTGSNIVINQYTVTMGHILPLHRRLILKQFQLFTWLHLYLPLTSRFQYHAWLDIFHHYISNHQPPISNLCVAVSDQGQCFGGPIP
jgi:hypothetical protein